MNQLRQFEVRVEAELKFNLDEVAWWNDMVVRGTIKAEHAKGYIDAAQEIITTKHFILSLAR